MSLIWQLIIKKKNMAHENTNLTLFDSEYPLLSTDFLIIYGIEYSNRFAVDGLYHIIFESIPHALNVSSSFSSCQHLSFIHSKLTKITFILNSRFSGF